MLTATLERILFIFLTLFKQSFVGISDFLLFFRTCFKSRDIQTPQIMDNSGSFSREMNYDKQMDEMEMAPESKIYR